MRNPGYVSLTLAGCLSAFVVSGMFPFLPKYLETAFRLPASTANYLTGESAQPHSPLTGESAQQHSQVK